MIRQDTLEQAFVTALSDKLHSVDMRGELVQALYDHLKRAQKQQD